MDDGVNIAARLEGVAKPVRVCLSEDAYRQVKGRIDLKVSDLGATQLKPSNFISCTHCTPVGALSTGFTQISWLIFSIQRQSIATSKY